MSRLSPRSCSTRATRSACWPPTTPTTAWHVYSTAAPPRSRGPLPDYLIPLGRTFGLPMNGAVSNLSLHPEAVAILGRELRTAATTWCTCTSRTCPWSAGSPPRRRARRRSPPSTPTPRTPGRHGLTANVLGARRLYSKLSARIAVSEAARWTARRYYGGRYRVVPNGVDLSAARPGPRAGGDGELEILFVGRAEGRKGLPVLLRAFEALRGAGVDARLTVAGATREEVEPLLLDTEGVEVRGPRVRGREVAPARRGRPALRAVAGRRELRHGADRGVRLVHAGRRLRHRRLPRRGARPPGRPAGAARRRRRAGRGAARAGARPRAARAHGRPRRASAPSASPGRRWPREVVEVYEEALAQPAARGPRRPRRGRAGPHARPSRARASARGACPRSSRRSPARRPPPRAWPARAVVGAGARGRRRAGRAGARPDRARADRPLAAGRHADLGAGRASR